MQDPTNEMNLSKSSKTSSKSISALLLWWRRTVESLKTSGGQLSALFWLSLLVKFFIAYIFPLSFDESYYWVWGHHLQLSYFDHPPFVSWLYWLGQPFENFGQWVRLPGVLLSHATLAVWVLVLKTFFNEEQLFWWLALALLTPLFGMGGLIVTPDIPLMFFWSVSLWALLECEKKSSLKNYAFLGAALGAGFLAKYHIVIFIPLGFIWLIQRKRMGKAEILPVTWSILWFLIVCSPVLVWNYQNDFASFRFQFNHGLGETHWSPNWPLKYLVDQLLIIFPPLLYLVLTKKNHTHAFLLKIMAWGPLVFFFLATFKADSEANWPIAAYPAVLALAVLSNPGRKIFKGTLAFWGLILGLVVTEAKFSWLPIEKAQLKTSEFFKFEPIIEYLKVHQEIRPMYAYSFQMASKLYYELKEPIYKLYGINRKDFYDFIGLSRPHSFPFYVVSEKHFPLPPWIKENDLQIVETFPVGNQFEIYKVDRK
ncbi:MAG: glycosyltransferase family 39 protein [Bdellovibrionales bacterium]|nr:glycosyltransferase family 39 protein [Bdellovibrionales bacterium]